MGIAYLKTSYLSDKVYSVLKELNDHNIIVTGSLAMVSQGLLDRPIKDLDLLVRSKALFDTLSIKYADSVLKEYIDGEHSVDEGDDNITSTEAYMKLNIRDIVVDLWLDTSGFNLEMVRISQDATSEELLPLDVTTADYVSDAKLDIIRQRVTNCLNGKYTSPERKKRYSEILKHISDIKIINSNR